MLQVLLEFQLAASDVQVVFSEYWWIGSKEENPDEERLDMPESLTKVSVHPVIRSAELVLYCGSKKDPASPHVPPD